MTVWPLRFRKVEGGPLLFADDAGGFFVSDQQFLTRYANNSLTNRDQAFLLSNGHAFGDVGDPDYLAFAYRWTVRQNVGRELAYVILVPTLRCNLACNYCQVSRAAEEAPGYDWTEGILADVIGFLDRLTSKNIKIEFQGGEPLLRPDLLRTVRSHCRAVRDLGVYRLHKPASPRRTTARVLGRARHIY